MDAERTSSHWLRAPIPFKIPSVEVLPDTADVVVLGAGIMGVSTAYWLARQVPGLSPLVIERNELPGMGASGRNGGLMCFGGNQAYADSVKELGPERAVEVQSCAEQTRLLLPDLIVTEQLDCGYQVNGCLCFAEDLAEEAVLKASAAALAVHGFGSGDVWLDRAAAQSAAGTELASTISGALLRRSDGVIHSGKYVAGMAAAAQRRGARFAFGTTVETVQSLTEVGALSGCWVVRTSRGTVICRAVVVALNAWSSTVFPELAPVITPVRGHVVLTEPAPFVLKTAFAANQAYEYGRQVETQQILLGGMRREVPDRDVSVWPPAALNTPPQRREIVAALERFLPALFPAASNLGVADRWTGTMGFTPDGNPLCGRMPRRPGVWILAGFSGHGMPYTQSLPLALAEQVATDLGKPWRPSPLPSFRGVSIPQAFHPERFSDRFAAVDL